ncbi:unnamed protein product [Strongylus vulgaris]|uniref:Uncharacterized protein n=1 Tax=Strongylus vulgaris TaxID=40348 RepID=A0A3P7J6W9_STRVU|nr:unnamed protein product [Strongylus vulgaris]
MMTYVTGARKVFADKSKKKLVDVSLEQFLLEHVKRPLIYQLAINVANAFDTFAELKKENLRKIDICQLIYQLAINVANAFDTFAELKKENLRKIDICQVNLVLSNPTDQNLLEFASLFIDVIEHNYLLPLAADVDGEKMRYDGAFSSRI